MMSKPLRFASWGVAAALGFGIGMAVGHAPSARAADPVGAPDTVTVFVGAHFGMREDGAAKALTRSHSDFAARGYRFASLAPYDENGDLQGFFVTYTRSP